MAQKPIATPLPADLPENWQNGQIVAPNGTSVGLTQKHGYNYQSGQINATQTAVNTINNAFPNLYGNTDIIPIANGGTAASTAAQARINLDVPSNTEFDGLADAVEEVKETADNALPKLGKGENLLDNWYFANPINQRGKTSYNGLGYSIDRWKVDSFAENMLTVNSDSVTLSTTVTHNANIFLRQGLSVPLIAGQKYTISMLVKAKTGAWNVIYDNAGINVTSGIWSYTFTAKSTELQTFYIWTKQASSSLTISAIKLELGDTQTLADASGNLLDPPPNPQQELAKCQRYCFVANTGGVNTGLIGIGNYSTGGYAMIPIYLPTTMQKPPNIVTQVGSFQMVTNGSGSSYGINSITLLAGASTESLVCLHVKTSSSSTLSGIAHLRATSADSRIIISCED